MIKPTISAVIPVYNEENEIGACVDSLLKQTVVKDMEIILVDDGSTDETLAILHRVQDGGENIKVFKQDHKGAGAARNLGVKKSRGKILVFVDADMTFERNFLEKLTEPIVKGGAKGTTSREEYVGNWENVWARCWNYNSDLGKSMHKEGDLKWKGVFRAILKSEFEKVNGFGEGGYTDDLTLRKKLGYEPELVNAKFYHNNPDNLGEVFGQAKWVGKRKYKLGYLGFLVALLRVFLPVSKLTGIYKAIKYKTWQFFIFKLVYNTGMTFGIISYMFTRKGMK